MRQRGLRNIRLSLVFSCAIILATLATPAFADSSIALEKQDKKIVVTIDGELFTQYIWDNPKPYLYPVHGPEGVRMVRHYPMQEGVEGEATDHPHQQSLWWAHGDINGSDYWHHRGTYETPEVTIVQQGDKGVIRAKHVLLDPEGERVAEEVRTIAFHGNDDARFIDFTISVIASDGELSMARTKEAAMGIRTHPDLRLDRGGNALNSEGHDASNIWGKRAKWINYYGEIEGNPVGVAIFDHPNNPRHPTWWHARGYGLLAANAFGDTGFEGEYQNRPLIVPDGHAITWRFRFYFHKGDPESARTAEHFEAFAADE